MKKIFFVLYCSLTLLYLVSCKKDGCTDPQAKNYNEEANQNDGSCTYQSQASFWFNQNISNWLAVTYGVTQLTVYLNDVSVGTIDPTDWKVGPDCSGANFTVLNDMGSVTTKSYAYEVRDQNGNLQFYGNFSVTANDCKSIELVW